MKKYELTENFIMHDGRKLFQIRALTNIKDVVKAGELGGYVENETNLDQTDNAWVYDNAKVYGYARVYGDARVSGNACAFDSARVYGDAKVYGNARIYDNAKIFGNARISGNVWVYGNACAFDSARVSGDAKAYGNARIYDDAKIFGNARISGNADILQITGLGTVHRTTTAHRTEDGIEIVCGCFRGGLEAFKKQVANTREGKVRDEYLKFAELVEVYFGI